MKKEINMRLFAFTFLLGISCIYLFHSIPAWYWILPIVVSGLFFIHFKKYYCIGFLLGLAWLICYLHLFVSQALPTKYETKKIAIQGTIISIPDNKEQLTSFMLVSKNPYFKGKIKLNWYGKYPRLSAGQIWNLTVKLKRIHGLRNPSGFDYDKWAFANNIIAKGYVINKSNNKQLKNLNDTYLIPFIRNHISDQIARILASYSVSPFVLALTVGDKHLISKEAWNVLQATGTSHLMAISGLHIGLIATLVFFLIKYLWRIFPSLCLLMASQQAAAIISFLSALIYSALAGFAVPTQRALIMLFIVLFALWCKRSLVVWYGFAFAIFMVLFLDPLSVLSMSFWLSFSAVGVILYGLTGRMRQSNKLMQLLKIQWIVGLGLIPLSLLFFQKASMISFIANIISIPWVSFIVVPSSLLGTALLVINHQLASYCFIFSAWNMQYVWHMLQYFSQFHFSFFKYHLVNFISFIFLAISLLLLLAPKGFPVKYLAILLLLPVFLKASNKPNNAILKFRVFDIGQGSAIFLQEGSKTLLYDTGPGFPGQSSAAEQTIIPYLKAKGITSINDLIISHFDSDHSGGFKAIINNFQVKNIYTPLSGKAHWQRCQSGKKWQWIHAKFIFLSPPKNWQGKKRNNQSCVLKVTYGNHQILLPGDIEKNTEKYLVKHHKKQLKSDVLLLPHHGSKTSSTWPFVKAVTPKIIIATTGYRNRFHFPRKNIVWRYEWLGAKLYNTAVSGMISIDFNLAQSQFYVEQYLVKNIHLWVR
jgi:competence protein ComEC